MDSMYQMLNRRVTRKPRLHQKIRRIDDNVTVMPNSKIIGREIDVNSVIQRQKLQKSNEGFIYIVSNKSWLQYLKIGRAIDLYKRVSTFNTYDPTRQFKLRCIKYFLDCKDAEQALHALFVKERVRGEWFRLDFNYACRSLAILTDSIKL